MLTPSTPASVALHPTPSLDPAELTELLGEAVPAFRDLGCTLVEIAEGYCRGELPLTRESTNHHGTHQGMLMGLLADYAAGVAVLSTLRNVPALGVQPVFGDHAAALWLARADLQYLEPSAEDLVIEARIDPAHTEAIRERFWSGAPNLVPVDVYLRGRSGTEVARGTMTIFVRHGDALRPSSREKHGGTMFRHMLKTSARLIASLRARIAASPGSALTDPWSERAAGRHGALLAERFLAILPQLEPMIAARTAHADRCLRAAVDGGIRQVVIVGAGLDTRPFRFASRGLVWFELDLPAMADERARVFDGMDVPAVERWTLPCNLDFDAPLDVLLHSDRFDPEQPVFVLFEGVSMYMDPATIDRVIRALADLVQLHPRSRIWMDLVRREALHPAAPAPVRAFLEGMARMGEPFRFGVDAVPPWLGSHGLQILEETSAIGPDPVLPLYRLVLAGPHDTAGITGAPPG